MGSPRSKKQLDLQEIPLNVPGDPILGRCDMAIEAIYRPSNTELQEYADNPLILALPEFRRQEILDSMTKGFKLGFTAQSRSWRKEMRLLALARIERVWVLLPIHIQLVDWFHIALRSRYVHFQTTETIKRIMQSTYASIQRGRYKVFSAPRSSHSECMPVLAISGVGKTTAVKMVLSTLPMIITHKSYKGEWLGVQQAVWVFVTCPHNGSVRSLLLGILGWFDLYIGTSYVAEVGDQAVSSMLVEKVIMVLSIHYTGILVIDEIHNSLRSANRTDLIDFLTNIFNASCCNFVVIGSPEVEKELKRFQTRRRVGSAGVAKLAPLRDGPDWERVSDAIMEQDFQRRACKDKERVRKQLLQRSAGMPAIAKLVWKLTQYEGIFIEDAKGVEGIALGEVTVELLDMAADRGLGLVDGMLEAIAKSDYRKIAELTGAAEDAVGAYLESMPVDSEQRRAIDESQIRVEKFIGTVTYLIDLGVRRIDAERLAETVIAENPNLDANATVRRAIFLMEKGVDEAPRTQPDDEDQKSSSGARPNPSRRSNAHSDDARGRKKPRQKPGR
ncbi:ATP-binding protein [Paraburkholderia youngii]|uniref:ATP-binding protein n=1 Tax=Paraburkholderia youngii TaxID=2782701 RepID=UPI003D1B57B3